PMTQLEMLKKKYLQHVFHKQDIYNTIYKLRKNDDERLDSVLFLDILLEKMSQYPCWKTFPEYEQYMSKKLYANRSSWAQDYTPFQFNAGIQSTKSIESFNNIIKRSLNSSSMLCELEEGINKRHEQESRYCKLVDFKAQHTTIGLPHISSQFFSTVNNVLISFLTPLILSLQRFQISQSFTYEGQREHVISEVCFIYELSDIVLTLKAILGDNGTSNIIEMWRIRRIGELSCKGNLVVLYNDGTHICTYQALENSPFLTAIESSMDSTIQIWSCFSTAKTAINITLESKSDDELVQLLKNFISAKRNVCNDNLGEKENNEPKDGIIALQWHLIDQTSDPHVTKSEVHQVKKESKVQ
ncbi:41903_t:CDS:2, partial [Gigaspora margarita]